MNKVHTHVKPASYWKWREGYTKYYWYLRKAAIEENPIKKELLMIQASECAAWNRKLDELTRKHYELYPPKNNTHDQTIHIQPKAYCIPCYETNWLKQVYA